MSDPSVSPTHEESNANSSLSNETNEARDDEFENFRDIMKRKNSYNEVERSSGNKEYEKIDKAKVPWLLYRIFQMPMEEKYLLEKSDALCDLKYYFYYLKSTEEFVVYNLDVICALILMDFLSETNINTKIELAQVIEGIAASRDEWTELKETIELWASSDDHSLQHAVIILTTYSNFSLCDPSIVTTLFDQLHLDISNSDSPYCESAINTLDCLLSGESPMNIGDIGSSGVVSLRVAERLPLFLSTIIKTTEEKIKCGKPDEVLCTGIKFLYSVYVKWLNVGLGKSLHVPIREMINPTVSVAIKVIEVTKDCTDHEFHNNAAGIICLLCTKDAVEADLVPGMISTNLLWMAGALEGKDLPAKNLFLLVRGRANARSTISDLFLHNKCGDHLVNITSQFLMDGDWKRRVAALVALEYESLGRSPNRPWLRSQDVPLVVEMACRGMLDENPVVRYSARQLFNSILDRYSFAEKTIAAAVDLLVTKIGEEGKREDGEEGGAATMETMWSLAEKAVTMEALWSLAEKYTENVLTTDFDSILLLLKTILRSADTGNSEMNERERVFVFAVVSIIVVSHERKCAEILHQVFAFFVRFNSIHVVNDAEPIDDCFACTEKKADVVIRKGCTGWSCGECACRPLWCLGCIGRVFKSKSKDILGQAPCPFCTKLFCVFDVLKVRYTRPTTEK